MRKVIYGAACSLDGFMTGADGAIDWLHFSKDVQEIIAKTWESADTVLMGRITWEVAQGFGGGGGGGMSGIRTYVFSRTLNRGAVKGATLVGEDAGEFVARLKREPGKDIVVMGGGVLAASLFAAGVIDEVGLNIHPVILGRGTPFFVDPGKRVNLELAENRTLDGGCVLITYRVATSGK